MKITVTLVEISANEIAFNQPAA